MGHNGFMKDKLARIHVRISADLKKRIVGVVEETGVDEATVVRNCLEALCNHFDETGSISFPMKMVIAKAEDKENKKGKARDARGNAGVPVKIKTGGVSAATVMQSVETEKDRIKGWT